MQREAKRAGQERSAKNAICDFARKVKGEIPKHRSSHVRSNKETWIATEKATANSKCRTRPRSVEKRTAEIILSFYAKRWLGDDGMQYGRIDEMWRRRRIRLDDRTCRWMLVCFFFDMQVTWEMVGLPRTDVCDENVVVPEAAYYDRGYYVALSQGCGKVARHKKWGRIRSWGVGMCACACWLSMLHLEKPWFGQNPISLTNLSKHVFLSREPDTKKTRLHFVACMNDHFLL